MEDFRTYKERLTKKEKKAFCHYLPTMCFSKPVWISFLCQTQRRLKNVGVQITLHLIDKKEKKELVINYNNTTFQKFGVSSFFY